MQFTNISDTEKVSIWSEMFDIGKMMAAAMLLPNQPVVRPRRARPLPPCLPRYARL